MRFKPFSEKYDYSKSELTEQYPPYMRRPIAQWFSDLASESELGYVDGFSTRRITSLKPEFINRLSTIFRQTFPTDLDHFMEAIFIDDELTSNFLALLLQNFCKANEAVGLEIILADGGSAFAVEKTDKNSGPYVSGVYNLVKRVPEVVADQAMKARSTSDLIDEAWSACYSRNPDYAKTVSKCCDALEHLLRDKYEPNNITPQLGKLLKDLQSTPNKLSFKGDTLLDNKSELLSLVSSATKVRGNHTAGTGRKPTPEEAEFVLHSTILIWNMHQGL